LWSKTLYHPRRDERLVFGLSKEERNHEDRVVSAIVGPLRASFRRALPTGFARKISRSRNTVVVAPESILAPPGLGPR
jgi:hypothetical protein